MDPSIANLYGRSCLSRRARPIPKLNVVNQNVQFSHRSPFAGPRTEKGDQPDQKITLGELRQYSSRSCLVGRNPESYSDHHALLLRVRFEELGSTVIIE